MQSRSIVVIANDRAAAIPSTPCRSRVVLLPPTSPPPRIVIVVVVTLRSSHLGFVNRKPLPSHPMQN